jgi:phage portal protein BeeE
VLQGGLKWRSITTSAADMQMLEHKESIIRDIARVYRIPLHLIIGTGGDSQTYQNLEALGSAFFKYTLLGLGSPFGRIYFSKLATPTDQVLT